MDDGERPMTVKKPGFSEKAGLLGDTNAEN